MGRQSIQDDGFYRPDGRSGTAVLPGTARGTQKTVSCSRARMTRIVVFPLQEQAPGDLHAPSALGLRHEAEGLPGPDPGKIDGVITGNQFNGLSQDPSPERGQETAELFTPDTHGFSFRGEDLLHDGRERRFNGLVLVPEQDSLRSEGFYDARVEALEDREHLVTDAVPGVQRFFIGRVGPKINALFPQICQDLVTGVAEERPDDVFPHRRDG